jgi:7,8-dihydropterin-6-yl-methyl-4-(beta-D-ribofuranosyl)aminobenzene 5'-phosphate synthase
MTCWYAQYWRTSGAADEASWRITLTLRKTRLSNTGPFAENVLSGGFAAPGANFQLVDKNTEIAPGMYLIALLSDKPGTLEVKELSLAIKSPKGVILILGCSHPVVEQIMHEAASIDSHITIVLGGLHQIQASDSEAERIADVLHDQYKIDRIAPGHCTGEQEFAALKKSFGDHYVYAGVGSVVDLLK